MFDWVLNTPLAQIFGKILNNTLQCKVVQKSLILASLTLKCRTRVWKLIIEIKLVARMVITCLLKVT